MGAKLFHNYLKQNLPNSIRRLSLKKYQNQILVVDVSNFLYKFLYSQGPKYLIGFLLFYRSLLKHNIYPIFCFDGKPPIEKKKIIEKRQKSRTHKQELIEKMKAEYYQIVFLLENSTNPPEQHDKIIEYRDILEEKIRINTQKCVQITSKILNNLKKLFDILGIKYIQAKDEIEADRLIGLLIRQKVADGCISNDIDPLIHGAKKLLCDFNYKSNLVLEYNGGYIMNNLKISYRQLVMMTVLLGSDYAPKVKHVSSVLLIEIAKTSNSLTMIADRLEKKGHTFLKENLELYQKAFNLYYEILPLDQVIWHDNLDAKIPSLEDADYNDLANLLKTQAPDYNVKLVKKCFRDIKKHHQEKFSSIFQNMLTERLLGKYANYNYVPGIKVPDQLCPWLKF